MIATLVAIGLPVLAYTSLVFCAGFVLGVLWAARPRIDMDQRDRP